MNQPLDNYRENIRKLYLEDNKSLKVVMDEMKQLYGVEASKNQYETKLKEWKFRKNLTKRQWQWVHSRLKKRKADGKDDFELKFNGSVIDKKRVCKEVNRNKPWTIQESQEAADAPTPVGLSILSPPASEPTLSPVHQSLDVVSLNNSTRIPFQHARNLSELASLLTRLGTPEQNSAALDSQSVPDDLTTPASLLPTPEEEPTTVPEPSEIPTISKTRDLGGIGHNHHHSVTYNDLTLLEFNEESHSFKFQSPPLSLHSLRISAPKSGTFSIYSGLSRDPRSEGSIITDWSDKNGLTTEQWNTHLDRESTKQLNTELQTASSEGHLANVKLLLGKGADMNAQRGYYGNSLHAASLNGHSAIVELLLGKGADVNAQGGLYGNALHAASLNGHSAIVELLLGKGADVNAQGGLYSNALEAASVAGHSATVELLLGKGADVNAQRGYYGNALQAASSRGHLAIVELLLGNGADINAQGGRWGNALQAASSRGHLAIVELLLGNGADVNAQGGRGNALQAASSRGHSATVELLLGKGANVNMQGGHYGNALQAASSRGHLATVKLLLSKGADVNAQGGLYSNALHAASWMDHSATVELLLSKGAIK